VITSRELLMTNVSFPVPPINVSTPAFDVRLSFPELADPTSDAVPVRVRLFTFGVSE